MLDNLARARLNWMFDNQSDIVKGYLDKKRLPELENNDPMLIAEVKTPFDAAVEAQVRDAVRTIRDLGGENNLPIGTPTIEPETIKVQGRNKAREYMAVNGIDAIPEPAGSWYTFATGRQIAGFPCSYCSWIERCLGARLELKMSGHYGLLVKAHEKKV